MSTPGDATTAALGRFIERTLAATPTLWEPWDPDWRSPCEQGPPVAGRVPWRPVPREWPADSPGHDFAGLEHALETNIHPDIRAWYGSWWSAGLEASAPDGHASLILLWNPADAERLISNLIGHAMNKQKLREPLTIFIACTEPDADEILTVDNSTGAVLLERPGQPVLRTVAPSLPVFLDSLQPADQGLHPERATPDPSGDLLA